MRRIVSRTAPSLVLALLAWSGRAHAQAAGSGGVIAGQSGEVKSRPDFVEEDLVGTPRDVRTLPRAPTLPDLTHHAPELSTEHTIASVRARGSDTRLTSHLFHFDAEVPLVVPNKDRSFGLYAGGQWGFAAARSPDASRFVGGQPQLFARAVHTLGSGERYAVGAGLAVLPPIFQYDDRGEVARLEAATPASLVSVVRPWDLSSFLDRRVTVRPWIDVRVAGKRIVAQFRQALDTNLRTSAASCSGNVVCDRAGDIQLVSITTFYLGWQPTREVALGVEAWEVYLLKTQFALADRDRSAFALSPSVRFFYRWVEPAVSVLFPVGKPLLGAAESYFAARIDLRIWFGGR